MCLSFLIRRITVMASSSSPSLSPVSKRYCSESGHVVKKIAVEGNIATGKSTFLSLIENHSASYSVIGEPLTRWTNVPADDEAPLSGSQVYGSNLLDLFYTDPKRYAYTFQTYACLSRLRAQLRDIPSDLLSVPKPVLFYERSVHSDKFCFAQNCYETGLFNDVEWSVYCDWHSFLVNYLKLQFDGFIYLQSSPKVALQRLKKRDRPEERGVTLEYLESLHKKHNNWLIDKKTKPVELVQKDVPVLTLDCDIEFENNEERQKESSDKTDELRGKVDVVKEQMRHNLESAMNRGDRLSVLEEKAGHLNHDAEMFQKTSKRVKRKEQCKHLKLWLLLCGIVSCVAIFLIIIIIVIAVVVAGQD